MPLHRNLVVGLAVALGLHALPAANAFGQTPSPAQSMPSLPMNVDRDPSPSIDPDNAPADQTATGAPAGVGAVGKDQTGRYTLEANAYEVQLHATVLDSSGRHEDDLHKENFRIFEDGVAQTITSFRHEDTPVSIGLLLDSSASMWDKRAAVEKAAFDLLRLSNPKDEAFLVDFNAKAYIDADFTSSPDKLQQGLHYVKAEGGTAAYDAVMASAGYMMRHSHNTKQVLLLVTDGEDNASRTSMVEMIRHVQGLEGPVIYCVGLLFGETHDKDEARRARAELMEIAGQTGGAAFFPKSLKEVDSIAAIVAEDIRTQYTIGYQSTNPPSNGGYRNVHVDAFGLDNRRLNVRTRRGYMAKAPSAPKPMVASTGAASSQPTR